MLAESVAAAAGLRMGSGAKAADGSGLASPGRSPEILTVKKRAAEKTEYMISAQRLSARQNIYSISQPLVEWKSLRNRTKQEKYSVYLVNVRNYELTTFLTVNDS